MDIDSVDYKADHRAKDQSIAEIQHEAKVLGQLKGFRVENVNMIYQTFVVHTQLWIVSELCAGGSVKTLVSLAVFRFPHACPRFMYPCLSCFAH